MERADGLEEGEEGQVQKRKKREKKEQEDNTTAMQVSGSS